MQYCFMFEHHGISDNEYICRIFDKLIDNANCDTQTYQYTEHDSSLLQGSNDSVKHPDCCPIPSRICHLNDDDVLDAGPSVSMLPTKLGAF